MGGWLGGWMDGRMDRGKTVLRIAYSPAIKNNLFDNILPSGVGASKSLICQYVQHDIYKVGKH